MSLTPGARLGQYEVLSLLGAGGMGEVYRARDTKLNRDVALKILPGTLASAPSGPASEDRVARFRREAQVLAALNHPNIAQVYGFEDSGDTHALVMELVEGATLAEIIATKSARGPGTAGLAPGTVLAIARQIALALEAAHEAGIVHRDLKPANIKVRDDGTVKVLDFGLAKAIESASGSGARAPASGAATMTSPATTATGIVLGTAAYMSPEQARGRPVDKRADIWAFGVVLWEMLTGGTLFAGETMSEMLAAVIKDEPPLDRLPADTPPVMRHVIARCLERDPMQRLRDIGEARIALSQPAEPVAPPERAPARPRTLWPILAASLAFAALAGAAAWYVKPATPLPVRRFDLPAQVAAAEDFAISPDGTRLAYVSDGHLWVRALDALNARDLARVHVTAGDLFWSPDGRTIGYTAEASLRTMPADGGAEFVVCKLPASGRIMGMRWLTDGRIVFSAWRDSLYEVAATGGTPTVRLAISPATEVDFHNISALPDGRLIIATHQRREDQDVIELVDGDKRVVMSRDPAVGLMEYVRPGVLLFRRRTTNAGLWSVPFDGGPIDFGKATLIQAGPVDMFSVADDGTVVFSLPAPPRGSLVWADRTGAITPVPGSPIELARPELEISPDGGRAAFISGTGPEANLFVRDLQAGTDTQLTFNKAGESGETWFDTRGPAWFPTGDRLLHVMGGVETETLRVRRADVAGSASELTAGRRGAVSPDGGTLFVIVDDRGRGRLRRAPLRADGTVGASAPVFSGEKDPDVYEIALSRDGRLLGYSAKEPDGRLSVFLTELPGASSQWLVTDGGTRPKFSPDSREIFFLKGVTSDAGQPMGLFMSARVTAAPTFRLDAPVQLFSNTTPNSPRIGGYDVAGSNRFLMWTPVAPPPGGERRLVLIQNWPALVRK